MLEEVVELEDHATRVRRSSVPRERQRAGTEHDAADVDRAAVEASSAATERSTVVCRRGEPI